MFVYFNWILSQMLETLSFQKLQSIRVETFSASQSENTQIVIFRQYLALIEKSRKSFFVESTTCALLELQHQPYLLRNLI